jgi:hypothetical protein
VIILIILSACAKTGRTPASGTSPRTLGAEGRHPWLSKQPYPEKSIEDPERMKAIHEETLALR